MKLGIQLYSVRGIFQRQPERTLQTLSKLGYRYLEAANHNAAVDDGVGFGQPTKELKRNLTDFGLKIIGCHINPLRMDRIDAVLDYHRELGNRQIGCDFEVFPYGDWDFVKARCELFNQISEKCESRGMHFYYHNHYQEFQRFEPEGERVYDFILRNTDKKVLIETDTYWMARGGVDPIDYIKRYQDRLLLIHQKDFPQSAPQPLGMYDGLIGPSANITSDVFEATINPLCFTEIGQGVLPIQSYIDAAADAPLLEYIILEQDYSRYDELLSVEKSMESFQKFHGIDLT